MGGLDSYASTQAALSVAFALPQTELPHRHVALHPHRLCRSCLTRPTPCAVPRCPSFVNPTPPTLSLTPQAYDALCDRLKELSALNGISGLLGWDEMVGVG